MAASKREELGQIVIRPPAGMRERIKAAADANNRSMNAEIVATLEEKYPAPAFDWVDAATRVSIIANAMKDLVSSFEGAKTAAEIEAFNRDFEALRREHEKLVDKIFGDRDGRIQS
ncbi:Arc family DNA-binding protein [Paracoccus haeundaensis]|uniref:Arc family DNA-binding protein n=1 Tax=Paracoccus haeundaensis TaxID=225362 RepID=A0A5C4RBC4_9RHOB|nr:Arc family DNA-binding protein [Paracoccus haeundaensis]TNH41266.1 Arc family DNA-binding protein [Paracoccus haeundaensis]